MTKGEQVERLNHLMLKTVAAIISTIQQERGLPLRQELDELATPTTRAALDIVYTNDLEEFEEQKLECNPDALQLASDLTFAMMRDKRWKKVLVLQARLEKDHNIQTFIAIIVIDKHLPARPETNMSADPKVPYVLTQNDKRFLKSLRINWNK